MRLGCYLTAFSFLLLIYGIDNISHSAEDSALASRNTKRVTLTYEQFAKRHPKEGWFRISGGVLDLPSARAHILTFGHHTASDNSGAVTALDIPLRNIKNFDAEPKPRSPVLVTTTDEALIKTWTKFLFAAMLKALSKPTPTPKNPTTVRNPTKCPPP